MLQQSVFVVLTPPKPYLPSMNRLPIDNYRGYAEGEPLQEVTLTIRFTTKHSPNNQTHLNTLLKTGYTTIVGERVYEENGKLIYEI